MEFTSVTPVILGALREGPRSGYEIKQSVDRVARFFWAASYGQIYPELRRLSANGLIEGESAPSGARRRTIYRLTSGGRQALADWLHSPSLTYELRDEALLKLFFADGLPAEETLEIVRAMRRRHLAIVDELQALEPIAREHGGGRLLVLETGLACHGAAAAWCEEMERRLLDEQRRSA